MKRSRFTEEPAGGHKRGTRSPGASSALRMARLSLSDKPEPTHPAGTSEPSRKVAIRNDATPVRPRGSNPIRNQLPRLRPTHSRSPLATLLCQRARICNAPSVHVTVPVPTSHHLSPCQSFLIAILTADRTSSKDVAFDASSSVASGRSMHFAQSRSFSEPGPLGPTSVLESL